MQNILVTIGVFFVLLLPVRLLSWWLKAGRQGWGRSFLVLFVGGLFVSIFGNILPSPWLASTLLRSGMVFAIFVVASGTLLEMKLWPSVAMALMICVVYSFTVMQPGFIGFSAQIG